jgi:hypothetical protein
MRERVERHPQSTQPIRTRHAHMHEILDIPNGRTPTAELPNITPRCGTKILSSLFTIWRRVLASYFCFIFYTLSIYRSMRTLCPVLFGQLRRIRTDLGADWQIRTPWGNSTIDFSLAWCLDRTLTSLVLSSPLLAFVVIVASGICSRPCILRLLRRNDRSALDGTQAKNSSVAVCFLPFASSLFIRKEFSFTSSEDL